MAPGRESKTGLRPLLLEEVHSSVWVGQVFSEAWCEQLLKEVEAYRAWSLKSQTSWAAPNSMHHRGIMLEDLGLSGLFDDWMRTRLQPWVEAHFGAHLQGPLIEYHAYVVEYSPESQTDLGFHVDDSQVTMNLCLGRDFEGSELYFEGPRCALHVDSPSRPEEPFVWQHRPGVAVLHAGKNRHGVRPIWKGRRWSLIVWFVWCGGRVQTYVKIATFYFSSLFYFSRRRLNRSEEALIVLKKKNRLEESP